VRRVAVALLQDPPSSLETIAARWAREFTA
jgi:hypothetical protein